MTVHDQYSGLLGKSHLTLVALNDFDLFTSPSCVCCLLVNYKRGVMCYGVYRPFQQYFNYIVAVSLIGGGNRSTQRNPLLLS